MQILCAWQQICQKPGNLEKRLPTAGGASFCSGKTEWAQIVCLLHEQVLTGAIEMVLYNVYTYRGSDKSSGGMQKKEGNMEIQLVKWGNGQGIRIPKLVLQELNIAVNDTLSMEIRGEQIIIEKVKFTHRSLEERARAYGGKLGPYTEYDWGEPKGREIW